MSSCTECHGMAGVEYDDHVSNDCPRWEDKKPVKATDTQDNILDELILEHKNKLLDHLHAAYHNPSLREDSPQFYIDLHKVTVATLKAHIASEIKEVEKDAYKRGYESGYSTAYATNKSDCIKAEGIGKYLAASQLMIPHMGYLEAHRAQGLPEMTSKVIVELYSKMKEILDENEEYMRLNKKEANL